MKIPKYVQELVKQRRIRPAPLDEQGELYDQKLGEYGFMFRVYRRDNYYRDYTFEAEVKRLVAWANRNYAEGLVCKFRWFTDKEHRKPYYKRDYAVVSITDPVAKQLEKMIEQVSKRC